MSDTFQVNFQQLIKAVRWLGVVLSIVVGGVQITWKVYSDHQEAMRELRFESSTLRHDFEQLSGVVGELRKHKDSEHGEIRGRIESLQQQLNAHIGQERQR